MKAREFQTVLIILCSLFFLHTANAQVGIRTTTPRKALEIAGDMKISQTLEVQTVNNISNSATSTFLLQEADNSIKTIDASNPTRAALGYIQEYIIVHPSGDWVRDFDTGIDATDFALVITSAVYDNDLKLSNDYIVAPGNSSIPYTATFIQGGTWHIIADYPMATNSSSQDIGTWIVTTLIFSNDLSKQFGIVSIPMANGTTGAASAPIID